MGLHFDWRGIFGVGRTRLFSLAQRFRGVVNCGRFLLGQKLGRRVRGFH